MDKRSNESPHLSSIPGTSSPFSAHLSALFSCFVSLFPSSVCWCANSPVHARLRTTAAKHNNVVGHWETEEHINTSTLLE